MDAISWLRLEPLKIRGASTPSVMAAPSARDSRREASLKSPICILTRARASIVSGVQSISVSAARKQIRAASSWSAMAFNSSWEYFRRVFSGIFSSFRIMRPMSGLAVRRNLVRSSRAIALPVPPGNPVVLSGRVS